MRRGYHAAMEGLKYGLSCLSPSHLKHKIGELQQMTVPEICVAFFKMIFYAFYYSGYGVSTVLQ